MYVKLHYSPFCFNLEPNFGLVRLRPTIIIVASFSPAQLNENASILETYFASSVSTNVYLFVLFIY